MIILIFKHLAIITMQSEFKGKYHVKVETREGEKTGPEPGSKLQMSPFHVKRKRSDIELCHIIYNFLRESSLAV